MTGQPDARCALVLDVDDTLVATFTTGLRKFALLADRFGAAPPSAEDLVAAGYGNSGFRACVQRMFPQSIWEDVALAYDALAEEVAPIPLGRPALLVAAARTLGWRVGVLTNGPHDKTIRKLTATGLGAGAVDFIRCAENSRVRKPDPAAFTDLCRAHGLAPARTWYVSDQPADWAGAEAAGLCSAGVRLGRPPSGRSHAPPRLGVRDTSDLVALLPALSRLRRPADLIEPCAVSFDLAGTLAVPRASAGEVLARAVGRYGLTPEPARLDACLAAGAGRLGPAAWRSDDANAAALTGLYEAVLREAGDAGPGVADRARAALRAFTAAANWRQVSAGRSALPGRVRGRGLATAVLSNWQSALADVVARVLPGVRIDHVMASCSIGAAKPEAQAFEGLAAALAHPVAALVHVGDRPDDDVAGALAAGSRAVYLPPDLPDKDLADMADLATGVPSIHTRTEVAGG